MKFSNMLISKKQFLCNKKTHIALSCHIVLFIDFARKCNLIIYCTEIAFC
jgi:hypothetical protein